MKLLAGPSIIALATREYVIRKRQSSIVMSMALKKGRHMAKDNTKKKKKNSIENDIYTALLGLTVLVMTATAIMVCLRSLDLYEAIF